ncbi:hypothetical protein KI387_028759 [Taxus chinensis]|uniref:Uncharacterized protein n=1 Tax=Taxus chinensis TaxID=29808 RepID=A0AA38CB69_TAXCH|nr:hypothetical protein KI387_028759 [Taxus chinensis]
MVVVCDGPSSSPNPNFLSTARALVVVGKQRYAKVKPFCVGVSGGLVGGESAISPVKSSAVRKIDGGVGLGRGFGGMTNTDGALGRFGGPDPTLPPPFQIGGSIARGKGRTTGGGGDNLTIYGPENDDLDNVVASLKDNQEEKLGEDGSCPTSLDKMNHMVSLSVDSLMRPLSPNWNQNPINKDVLEILLPIHQDENVDLNASEGLDPFPTLNHANIMEVPILCEIEVVEKVFHSNGQLAMEILCGQRFVQEDRVEFSRESVGKEGFT